MFKKEMKKYLIHKGEELKGIEAKYHFSGFSFFLGFFFLLHKMIVMMVKKKKIYLLDKSASETCINTHLCVCVYVYERAYIFDIIPFICIMDTHFPPSSSLIFIRGDEKMRILSVTFMRDPFSFKKDRT